jgi:hypothetical protein
VEGPFIRVEDSGEVFTLRSEVTTVGRGAAVDVRLGDPSVSRLHAEIVRRGPYTYVVDLGLSRNGTRVNGRPVARRLLEDGDVVSFGAARCRVGGVPHEDIAPDVELRRSAAPELTRRELDVLTSLCRPALSDEAFVSPATAREIAADLVVTEAAVKQHLLRLYQKFRIPEGANRRTRLANEVVALGLVRPLPPSERAGRSEPASEPRSGGALQASGGTAASRSAGSSGGGFQTAGAAAGGSQSARIQGSGSQGGGSQSSGSQGSGSQGGGLRGGGSRGDDSHGHAQSGQAKRGHGDRAGGRGNAGPERPAAQRAGPSAGSPAGGGRPTAAGANPENGAGGAGLYPSHGPSPGLRVAAPRTAPRRRAS